MIEPKLILKRAFLAGGRERVNSMKLTKRDDGEIQIFINNGKSKYYGYEKFAQYRLTVEDKEMLKEFLK